VHPDEGEAAQDLFGFEMCYITVYEKLVKLEREKGPFSAQVTFTFKDGTRIKLFDPDNLLLMEPGDTITGPEEPLERPFLTTE
jgi:hypothetical protein